MNVGFRALCQPDCLSLNVVCGFARMLLHFYPSTVKHIKEQCLGKRSLTRELVRWLYGVFEVQSGRQCLAEFVVSLNWYVHRGTAGSFDRRCMSVARPL